MSLLADTAALLKHILGERQLVVQDIRIGIFYTGALLSSGYAGLAFTPRVNDICCPEMRAGMPDAGKLAGNNAWDLASYALDGNPLKRAVGVAVLNAISAQAISEKGLHGYRVLRGEDALRAVSLKSRDRVTMIGAFIPYIIRLRDKVKQLRIIEKHPQMLDPDQRSLCYPLEQMEELIPESDVVIITGSAMVEGGLDRILELSKNAREVVLAGPTASIYPEIFFQRGVSVMGGIEVRDPIRLMQIISEGGSGYSLKSATQKITISRNR